MRNISAAAFALGSLVVTAPTMASDWYVTPSVGFVIADKDDFDFGPSMYLSVGRQVSDKWNIELSAAHSSLDVKDNDKYRRNAFNVSSLYFPWGQDNEAYNAYGLASIGGASVDFAGTSNYAPIAELGAGLLRNTNNEAVKLRGEVRYRMDVHRGKEEYDNDIFYEWTALVGAQLALGGHQEPMPKNTPAELADAPSPDAPLVLPAVTFPLDSAQLTQDSQATLDEVAAVLVDQPEMTVEVVGHADDSGPSDYNYNLSIKRAQAVVDYLIQEGVDADQLNQRGVGEGQPVASNATDDGRRRNRRVEFHVQ